MTTGVPQVRPSRVSLRIEGRVMMVGGQRVAFDRDDSTVVLSAYLRLIRAIRDKRKAPTVALRRGDIECLAAYLGLDGVEVLDRLASLMGATVAQRAAIGSLFAAGATVIALVVASQVDAGGIESAASATAFTVPSAVAASATFPPIIVEATQAADSSGLAPAVRVLPPVAVASSAGTPNRSGCNTDAAGAAMSLTIPAISYACPVVAGGQAQIDAGFVTLVTDVGPNAVLATEPGAAGTLWLAAHRSSNGSAFADVPGLADGALITVTEGGVTATYRVVGRSYVEVRNGQVVDANGNATALATWESIIRTDLSGNLAPRLVLQTCEGVDFRWMIYADLVA